MREQGTIFSALIGSLIIAGLNNAMSILNMPTASQHIEWISIALVYLGINMHSRGM